MKFRVWYNGGDSTGPHNWRYENRYEQALVPQTKAMNDAHLEQLKTEWLLTHNPPGNILNNPSAMKAWRLAAERKARDWAVKHEPKRFLNPLLRPMNGIPADQVMRRNTNGSTAVLSSSWVGDAGLNATGTAVSFDLGGKKYTFPVAEIGGLDGLKRCLSAPSIGRYIASNWIGKLPSSVKNRGRK